MLSSLDPRWVLWLWVSWVESASESEPSMATGVPGRKYFGRVAAGTKPYLSLIMRFALPFETKPFACKCAPILWVDSLVYRGHWCVCIDLLCLMRLSLWPVKVLIILRVDTLVCWWCWHVCIAAMASVSSSIPLFSFCYFRFPTNKQTNKHFLSWTKSASCSSLPFERLSFAGSSWYSSEWYTFGNVVVKSQGGISRLSPCWPSEDFLSLFDSFLCENGSLQVVSFSHCPSPGLT